MSGKTLGQIGYEAYCRHVDRISPPPWEHLHSGYQDGWQEVANAVAAHAAGTAAEDDGAAEITRLTSGEHPAFYARWVRSDYPDATDAKVARLWKSASEGDRQFWAQIVTARRDGRVALENQVAHGDRLAGKCEDLRSMLDGIGVMAANAPEDGDSFGLLEQIAMRIAAVDVPDTTPIDEWPDPENPVTGRTPGAADLEVSAFLAERNQLRLAAIKPEPIAEPQPAPELAAELDQLRERVARVAAALDADALATAPSKKSQIQEDAARRIREALA